MLVNYCYPFSTLWLSFGPALSSHSAFGNYSLQRRAGVHVSCQDWSAGKGLCIVLFWRLKEVRLPKEV